MNLVEPRDASPRESVEQDLLRGGVPPSDAAWLSSFLVSVSYAGTSAVENADYDEQLLLDRLGKPIRVAAEMFERAAGDRNRAILWLMATLPGISPRYMLDDSLVRLGIANDLVWRSQAGNTHHQHQARLRVRAAIVLAFLRYALHHAEPLDFHAALRDLPTELRPDGPAHPVSLIAGRVLLHGKLNLGHVLDVDRITSASYMHSDMDAHGDPRMLEFWFDASAREWEMLWPGPRRRYRQSLWPWLATLFHDVESTRLGPLAIATWRSYRRWLWVRTKNQLLAPRKSWIYRDDESFFGGKPERDVIAANDLSTGIAKCADALASRLSEAQSDWQLSCAAAAFSFRAYFQRSGRLATEARTEVAAASTEVLGRMRVLLSGSDTSSVDFADRLDAYWWVVQYLAGLKSIWAATKPLLLALRSLTVPAVAPDLRYWHVPDSPEPPRPWAWVAETLSAIPHTFAKLVERKDRELNSFKSEFAGYCLDRLKSRKVVDAGAERMVEPDPQWRYAYVRAFAELGVDPKRRAAKVLRWSAANDPDPEVRKAASDAVSGLNARSEADGRSHRRGIFAAFWWLRQAHFLSLGGELDVAGAQRTFRREVRRTVERRKPRNT